MDHSAGVGAIVGLTFASSVYVWKSESFSRLQKTLLYFCIIFPPAQWLGILVMIIYNNGEIQDSSEKVQERKVEEVKANLDFSINNLTELRDKGILTDIEYYEKVSKIKTEKAQQEIQKSSEYKQLKSLRDSAILTDLEFEEKIKLININPDDDIKKSQQKTAHLVNDVSIQDNKIVFDENSSSDKTASYLLIICIILIIGGVILYNIQNKTVDNYDEPMIEPVESVIETPYKEEYKEELKIKKFVYVVFKAKTPKLVYFTTGGITQFDLTENHYYTNWDEFDFTTDIIEVEDYTEDNKNRILDQTAFQMSNKFNMYNADYLTDILINCKDPSKRAELKKEKSQIVEQNIYSFDSYSEASTSKRVQ